MTETINPNFPINPLNYECLVCPWCRGEVIRITSLRDHGEHYLCVGCAESISARCGRFWVDEQGWHCEAKSARCR